MMNRFYLVFEDLLRTTQKSIAGPFSAESREALVEQFQLKVCKNVQFDWPATYWDGKTGNVLISIVLASDPVISGHADLQKHVHMLHCNWY